MDYNFSEIENKWQKFWADKGTFHATNDSEKPKYYVLDMFPYPSGAGLHVGHPLGYIASDIVSRYKRHKGFNVLHPMGYDSFGLPAEQYAIQTGQHPAITTKENIARYREQLDKIGFSFDWSREVRTSDPEFYKWTQWIFLQLFDSWYNKAEEKAQPIADLILHFEKSGTDGILAATDEPLDFTAAQWNTWTETEKAEALSHYRLAYRSESTVNWCPALGTVLANDEVKDGVSERGGHPVVQKKMMQWSLRISAYAERLLQGLEEIDWTEALKESQRNWIGKSKGASVHFQLKDHNEKIEVFTTRPDTIFGVTFMVLAPEHELVDQITTPEYKAEVDAYKERAAKRSERDRMADVKTVSGQFTGAYVAHPFSGKEVPVWIGDYVLASYGTGAVMSVPAHDSRDWAFAKHFDLPIVEVVSGGDVQVESYDAKEGTLVNSDFLDGHQVKDAIAKAITQIEEQGLGKGKTQYRLRDAIFGRQRYWGEPIPVYFEDGMAKPVKQEHLPLVLPEVDKFLPTEDGEPPLARATQWSYHPEKGVVAAGEGFPLETTTMPGWAGSSWYDLRYMDPNNKGAFADKEVLDYWQNVDLYIGGSEHATGHLLYTRFWHKFLKDLGYIKPEEPFKKLINQGMIQGTSGYTYRLVIGMNTVFSDPGSNPTLIKVTGLPHFYVSSEIGEELFKQGAFIEYSHKTNEVKKVLEKLTSERKASYPNEQGDYIVEFVSKIPVDVKYIDSSDNANIEALKAINSEYANAEFITVNGNLKLTRESEKMSKSKYNVVNPDDIVTQYGADTLRMYEMFLGPLEQSKPWNTAGITGVHNFLRKFWKLYAGGVSEDKADKKELKALHTLIKKVNEDIEAFSFNTSVSAFMICVNELNSLKCTKREILEPLAVCISPFAPHIAEELWVQLGHKGGISEVDFPVANEEYLVEDSFTYPVAFNGKTRFTLELPLGMSKDEVEKTVRENEQTAKYVADKTIRKVIVVPGKIVNMVVG